MTTTDVAHKLVQLCRNGKVEEAKLEFFTEDTLSPLPPLVSTHSASPRLGLRPADLFNVITVASAPL